MSPADLADLRRQNPKTAKLQQLQQLQQPQTTCLSLRDNAACCIPLRHLRYLRENIHIRVLNLSAQRNPNVSRRSRWLRRQNPITTLTTNCLSLRYNAACCIPLRNLRYLRENTRKSTQSICTKKPQCLPQISQIHADKPQNHKTTLTSPNCLSLRNNAACCIPLRDLRNLRENNTQEDSINLQTKKPQYMSRW